MSRMSVGDINLFQETIVSDSARGKNAGQKRDDI